jgi:phosphomannomutase
VTYLKVSEVIVGHDMRLSVPAIFDAVTRGIIDQGADVIEIGLVSTDPGLLCLCPTWSCPA